MGWGGVWTNAEAGVGGRGTVPLLSRSYGSRERPCSLVCQHFRKWVPLLGFYRGLNKALHSRGVADVGGMSLRRGLFCRYPDALHDERLCQAVFFGPIPKAAADRNAHELALHGYHHEIPRVVKMLYGAMQRKRLK